MFPTNRKMSFRRHDTEREVATDRRKKRKRDAEGPADEVQPDKPSYNPRD
jgi:hypothetical protein